MGLSAAAWDRAATMSPWLAFSRKGWHVAERTKQEPDEAMAHLEDRLTGLRESLQQIRREIQALTATTAELTALI